VNGIGASLTVDNAQLMKYYQTSEFKEEFSEAIKSQLDLVSEGDIPIKLSKKIIDPLFLRKYNLLTLSDKELELIFRLDPKLKFISNNNKLLRIANSQDLIFREDNYRDYYLTQNACSKDENNIPIYCFKCDNC